MWFGTNFSKRGHRNCCQWRNKIWDLHEICLRFPWDLHDIYLKIAWVIFEIFPSFVTQLSEWMTGLVLEMLTHLKMLIYILVYGWNYSVICLHWSHCAVSPFKELVWKISMGRAGPLLYSYGERSCSYLLRLLDHSRSWFVISYNNLNATTKNT